MASERRTWYELIRTSGRDYSRHQIEVIMTILNWYFESQIEAFDLTMRGDCVSNSLSSTSEVYKFSFDVSEICDQPCVPACYATWGSWDLFRLCIEGEQVQKLA